MAPTRSSDFPQHLASGWLLANGALIVFWPASLMDWYPWTLALVLWPIAAVGMLLGPILWSAPRRRRIVALATVGCGIVVGWEALWLGPMFHVWWRQDGYLAQARAALADPPPPPACGPKYIEVDHSDAPPVRVAFFVFAAHGDVEGIVYDPTGLAAEKPRDWLYGARPCHLFGPWYRF